LKIPEGIPDEQVLFLSDICPTGFMAAENCRIQPGDVIAVWGCGPVGQFAIKSAYWLGAERVIAIDDVPERLAMAHAKGGAEVINFAEIDVFGALREMTGGRGPDACIDAVGMEAHGTSIDAVYDRVKHAMMLETDRPSVLRQAIHCCRKGGTVSLPGVYGGVVDKIPLGAAFAKALTLKMGQTHTHRYMQPILERIQRDGEDLSYVITHDLSLDEAPEAYATFNNKEDNCLKVVLHP
jgi:threonine dehydrogenase-like Zn-dependent dehydrogenase